MTLLLMCTVDRGLGRGGLSEHPVLHTHTHTHTHFLPHLLTDDNVLSAQQGRLLSGG